MTQRRLLSTSSRLYAARIGGAGLIFLAQAGIARFWGAEYLAEYLLIIATVNIVSVLMPLGFETIGTYFAAQYRAKGEGRMLRAFMLRAHLHIAVTSVVLCAAGLVFLGALGEPGRILLTFWVPTCIMAVANALVLVNGSLMIGLKHPYIGFFADSVFRPLLIAGALAVTVLMMVPDTGFVAMIWAIGIGYFAIALVHLGYTLRAVSREVATSAPVRPDEARRWWRFALPWVVIVIGTEFFFDVDLLILAGLLGKEELAIFGVCARIFALVAFGVTAVYAVTLPDMFESEANSDRAGFLRKVGDANLVAAVFAFVMFVGVTLAGPLALMLFGPTFLAGHVPLIILSLALVVRSFCGPAALMISLNDRPNATLPAIALGMVVLVVGNLLLVPLLGITGAALAALLGQAAWSVAMWFTAMRLTGVDVSIVPKLREMILARRRGAPGIKPRDASVIDAKAKDA